MGEKASDVDCPIIRLVDNSQEIVLFDKFTDDVERDQSYSFEQTVNGELCSFSLNCFLVPKNYSDDKTGTNSLFFGANGRAVKRYEMDKVIGLKAIDGKYAFFGYLEATLLNESVNDTRTEFSLDDDTIDDIKRECIEKMQDFLATEIGRVKSAQIEQITKVRNQHLRFFNIAKNPEEIAENFTFHSERGRYIR